MHCGGDFSRSGQVVEAGTTPFVIFFDLSVVYWACIDIVEGGTSLWVYDLLARV